MLNELVLIVLCFLIFLFSVIIHEVAHGLVALWLGDPTAKYAGRLTLNPVKHIDPWGSIIVPIIMFTGLGLAFGWAKPVPYNPYNLKNQKWGPAMVALGGPASNILIALVFAILAKLINIPENLKEDMIARNNFLNFSNIVTVIHGSLGAIFVEMSLIIIAINVFLAFFNLIPIPPLDGSKLLFAIISVKTETAAIMEQFGFMLLLFFVFISSRVYFLNPIGNFLDFMVGLFLKIVV